MLKLTSTAWPNSSRKQWVRLPRSQDFTNNIFKVFLFGPFWLWGFKLIYDFFFLDSRGWQQPHTPDLRANSCVITSFRSWTFKKNIQWVRLSIQFSIGGIALNPFGEEMFSSCFRHLALCFSDGYMDHSVCYSARSCKTGSVFAAGFFFLFFST